MFGYSYGFLLPPLFCWERFPSTCIFKNTHNLGEKGEGGELDLGELMAC
jgi:hypothetical protein